MQEILTREVTVRKLLQQYAHLKSQLDETTEMLKLLGARNFHLEPASAVKPQEHPRMLNSSEQLRDLNLSTLIRLAAQNQGGIFTRNDVAKWITLMHPAGAEIKMESLSALVSTIARSDNWEVVNEGGGGKLAVYRLKHSYTTEELGLRIS